VHSRQINSLFKLEKVKELVHLNERRKDKKTDAAEAEAAAASTERVECDPTTTIPLPQAGQPRHPIFDQVRGVL
jgi:hypothetical protein